MRKLNKKAMAMLIIFAISLLISILGITILIKATILSEISCWESFAVSSMFLAFNITAISFNYLKERCN